MLLYTCIHWVNAGPRLLVYQRQLASTSIGNYSLNTLVDTGPASTSVEKYAYTLNAADTVYFGEIRRLDVGDAVYFSTCVIVI